MAAIILTAELPESLKQFFTPKLLWPDVWGYAGVLKFRRREEEGKGRLCTHSSLTCQREKAGIGACPAPPRMGGCWGNRGYRGKKGKPAMSPEYLSNFHSVLQLHIASDARKSSRETLQKQSVSVERARKFWNNSITDVLQRMMLHFS